MVTHKGGGYRMHRFIDEIILFKKWKKTPNQNYLYTIWLGINSICTQTVKRMNTLWWKHMGWNPKLNWTTPSTIKSKKRYIYGGWWWCESKVFVDVAIFYTNLFVWGNVHYELLFFDSACCVAMFHWAHLWWSGYVCMSVLMDVNQRFVGEDEDKDKRRSC
jgi:hypothetical protein